MSSSRILSSRPSASCITAKPMARTIKGRGRNASPFFSAQKQGKLRAFPQSPPGALIYGFPSRKPHSPPLGRCGGTGASASPSRKQESRAGFSARVRRRHLLYGFPPRKSYSLLPGRSGAMDASASRRREWEPCHKRKKAEEISSAFLIHDRDYLVPKIRSPASPRPGMMYLCSSRWSSREAQ